MREFSVPPVATIAETVTLIDSVWHNAEEAPDAVPSRGLVGRGVDRGHLRASSATR